MTTSLTVLKKSSLYEDHNTKIQKKNEKEKNNMRDLKKSIFDFDIKERIILQRRQGVLR